ncbi:sugar phosphate isomerase/epimerase [Vallitalea pronyensis]|uniref:Sugar phosphate isomerase/epimerase n=1 Tax=Vallitalea pronyensis TaxID=1348613 RepID=A0A8J8SJ02_9FIRM|nr:sugar phosphate isomerase/epimerase [Vallitalea pronyensis]QUI25151.1 sugar phosphate isomerase/epimerase [Vallitalea pronyensis]
MIPKIAVQLYTVREECQEDFVGTLEKVAALGYEGVELAGTYGLSSEVLKNHLNRLQLEVVGHHIMLEALEDDLEEVIAYNKAIGNDVIICPWATWDTEEELRHLADRLNTIGKRLEAVGLTFLYHNHHHEFEKIGDMYGLDLLFQLTRESHMLMELDTHWVKRAGLEVLPYMDANGSLIRRIHIKDMQELDGEMTFAAIGEGFMDIPAILKKAEAINCPWAIVENDQPQPDGMTNITQSIQYLQSL